MDLFDLSFTITVYIYYLLWGLKASLKGATVILAYGYMFLSALRFSLEGLAEWHGAKWCIEKLQGIPATWKWIHISTGWRLSLFAAAAVFVVISSFEEMKKPKYESSFLEGLLDAMSQQRRGAGDWTSLQIFHALFTRRKVAHVSVYRFEKSTNKLHIVGVYPNNPGQSYYQDLDIGQGVAGRVYNDRMPRYVACLFLLPVLKNWFYMPHAVRFQLSEEKRSGRPSLKLRKGRIDADVVWSDDPKKFSFPFFLSVPILSASGAECVGVLNFDFAKPGHLNLVDITMASVLGIWCGLQLTEVKDDASRESVVSSKG